MEQIKGDEVNKVKKIQNELKQIKKKYEMLQNDFELMTVNNEHLKTLIYEKDSKEQKPTSNGGMSLPQQVNKQSTFDKLVNKSEIVLELKAINKPILTKQETIKPKIQETKTESVIVNSSFKSTGNDCLS